MNYQWNTLVLLTGNVCNAGCLSCYRRGMDSFRGYMPPDLGIKILNRWKELNPLGGVFFEGMEPFWLFFGDKNPTRHLMEEAMRLRFPISTVTNGFWGDGDYKGPILEWIKNHPELRVGFSLDAMHNDERFNSDPVNPDAVYAAIKAYRDLGREVGINVVSVPGATTKINMALLKGLYEFLRIQGDPNECGIYVKEMDPPLGIMDRDGNLFGSGSNRKKLGHCPALARDEVDLRISPDGTVTFCYYPSKGIPIGVFTEGSFLADIVYLEGAKPSVRQAFQMLRTYSWGQILNFAREVEGVKGVAEGIIKNPTSFNPCGTCFHVSSLPPDEFDSLFQAAYDYTQRRKPWNLLRR